MNLKEIILSNLYVIVVSIFAILVINFMDSNPLDYDDKWTVLLSLSGFMAAIGMYIAYMMTKKKEFLWSIVFYGIVFISFFVYSLYLR